MIDKYPLVYLMFELPMYHPAVFAEQHLRDWGLYHEAKFETIYQILEESFTEYSFDFGIGELPKPGFDNIIRQRDYSDEGAEEAVNLLLKLCGENVKIYPSDVELWLEMDYDTAYCFSVYGRN